VIDELSAVCSVQCVVCSVHPHCTLSADNGPESEFPLLQMSERKSETGEKCLSNVRRCGWVQCGVGESSVVQMAQISS